MADTATETKADPLSEGKSFIDLRGIDVSGKTKKKGNFSYLSWAWAYDMLMQNDENAEFSFPEPQTFNNGSVMIYCTVRAFGKSKTAYLPVMDFKHNAIENPDATEVNKAMQRCLTKAIALHGIGLYIYEGEDLPDVEPEPDKPTDSEITYKQDICHLINCAETEEDIQSIVDEYGQKIGDMPEALQVEIGEFELLAKEQRSRGVVPEFNAYRFGHVDSAIKYKDGLISLISKATDYKKLEAYTKRWGKKIQALDTALKAKKYEIDGVSPAMQVMDAYNEKMIELMPKQETAK